jgi:hypothetical protein
LLKSLPDYRPEIEREKSYFNRLLGMNFGKISGYVSDPSLWIVGCLDYSVDYSNVRHQTMFLYDLTGLDLRTADVSKVGIARSYGKGNNAN